MFEKMKTCVLSVEKKVIPAVVAVSCAVSTMAVGAFAEEAGGGGIDISSVTSSMQSALTGLVTAVAVACGATVVAGLTIFGLKYAVKTIKSFFAKIAG